jgi:hypothetical protein
MTIIDQFRPYRRLGPSRPPPYHPPPPVHYGQTPGQQRRRLDTALPNPTTAALLAVGGVLRQPATPHRWHPAADRTPLDAPAPATPTASVATQIRELILRLL